MEDQPLPDCWQMNVSITKAAVLINSAHLLRGPNASYKHERDIFNLKLYLERRHDLQQETMHSNNLFFFTGFKRREKFHIHLTGDTTLHHLEGTSGKLHLFTNLATNISHTQNDIRRLREATMISTYLAY